MPIETMLVTNQTGKRTVVHVTALLEHMYANTNLAYTTETECLKLLTASADVALYLATSQ